MIAIFLKILYLYIAFSTVVQQIYKDHPGDDNKGRQPAQNGIVKIYEDE